MADYARLRNRTNNEYVDDYTEANRRAWRIELKNIALQESPSVPPAGLSTIASSAKLGSNIIALLKDVLNNVRLRVNPVYLYTKPSTLDFSKAKEVLGEYINELRYTILPILRNSASGSNNTLLSNTFNDLSEILRLLNMIITEFNKIEIETEITRGLERYRPESIKFSQLTNEQLINAVDNYTSGEQKQKLDLALEKALKEKRNEIRDELLKRGVNVSIALTEASKYQFDRRTKEYRDILEKALRDNKISLESQASTQKAIFSFYENERDSFIDYRNQIIALVKTVSNYQSQEIPFVYGSTSVPDLLQRIKLYVITRIGSFESPENLRRQYPLLRDLPDFSKKVDNYYSKETSTSAMKIIAYVNDYLERITKRQQLSSIKYLSNETLKRAYEDIINNEDFNEVVNGVYNVMYNFYKKNYARYIADEGRDIKDQQLPQEAISTATTNLTVEDAPIRPTVPIEQEPEQKQDEEEMKGQGRRVSNPRIVYDGKSSRMSKVAGKQYAMMEEPKYDPLQSLLDRFNAGEKKYIDEQTKDNLRFRVHKKGKK
jgi:hypothetical protein